MAGKIVGLEAIEKLADETVESFDNALMYSEDAEEWLKQGNSLVIEFKHGESLVTYKVGE